MKRNVAAYQAVFLEHNGPLPHPCAYETCYRLVTFLTDPGNGRGPSGGDAGVIHHVDEDCANNAPENLQIMHHSCHRRHHTVGRPAAHGYTPEVRAKISESLKGGERSTEMRAKISNTLRGRRPANLATLHSTRARCECGMESAIGSIASHASRRGHTWQQT